MPKQRIGWDDYKVGLHANFPRSSGTNISRKSYWLMVGPTGPRRLPAGG